MVKYQLKFGNCSKLWMMQKCSARQKGQL